MDIIKENYRRQAEALTPKFARRNTEAFYCDTAEEAICPLWYVPQFLIGLVWDGL